MKSDNPTGCCRLPESNIVHNTTSAKDRNTSMAAMRESGNALHDVTAGADFQDMAVERIRAFFGDDNGRFWFVL